LVLFLSGTTIGFCFVRDYDWFCFCQGLRLVLFLSGTTIGFFVVRDYDWFCFCQGLRLVFVLSGTTIGLFLPGTTVLCFVCQTCRILPSANVLIFVNRFLLPPPPTTTSPLLRGESGGRPRTPDRYNYQIAIGIKQCRPRLPPPRHVFLPRTVVAQRRQRWWSSLFLPFLSGVRPDRAAHDHPRRRHPRPSFDHTPRGGSGRRRVGGVRCVFAQPTQWTGT
jgi:hypothetical protein